MTLSFPGIPNAYPTVAPYVAQIPHSVVQGDSAQWIDVPFCDVNGVQYDSSAYSLKYTLAGPTTPLALTAAPQGSSWQTSLTTTQSAALTAGTYFWTAQVSAASVRITIATGELKVAADLAGVGAGYDGRSQAEIAYSQAQTALATFQASGGRIESYTIGNRHMSFQRDQELVQIVSFWKAAVVAERIKAKGSRGRHIAVRFERAR